MDKVDVAGRASAQNGRGRDTIFATGARPQVLGRQSTREERDNDIVTRLYNTRGRNRQFGQGATPASRQYNRPTTRSQSIQSSTLRDLNLPRIEEETQAPPSEKTSQADEVSSKLLIHDFSDLGERTGAVQHPPNNAEILREPFCQTRTTAHFVASNPNGELTEDLGGLPTSETFEPLEFDMDGHTISALPGNNLEEQRIVKDTENQIENPRQLNLYSFDATDKEIFSMIRQQVIDNRNSAEKLLHNNKHLGIGFIMTEAEEVGKLISRVAPELRRFLPEFYPIEFPLTRDSENQKTQIPSATPPSDPHGGASDTIRVALKADKIPIIQKRIDYLSQHTVLARITGRNPGMRKLTLWARARLHRSFKSFTIRANNYMEIEFEDALGRDQALEVQYYDMSGQTICILPWSPYFNFEEDYASSKSYTSLWVQIVDLPPFYRSKDIIQDFVSAFAEVISVDDTESYRTKLSGPRIRIITTDVEKLPKMLTLPRHDGRGDVAYKLAYSGLPEQCGRCRSYEHTVSQCNAPQAPNREHTHQ